MTEIPTYIEEESAVYHLCVADVRQVLSQFVIFQGELLQIGSIELLEAGDGDGAELSIAEKLLASTQGVAHEVHSAVVIWGQMELAFDGQDDVEILLRLHKVPEVGCDHL